MKCEPLLAIQTALPPAPVRTIAIAASTFLIRYPLPSAALSESASLNLFDPLNRTQPAYTALNELFDSGSQLCFMQMEIVYGANARDALLWVNRADTVHERTTRRTEIVGHGVARGDGARLAEGLQVVLAAYVLQMRVGDDEVGREHGCGDLMTVRAVADEAVDQSRALGWLNIWRYIRAEEMNDIRTLERRIAHWQVDLYPRVNSGANLRMPIARHRRSMWPLLRPL